MPFLNNKPLKLYLRVFLTGHTVAMVTYYVMKRTTTCSPIVGQCFDTMIVASSDKEWLQWPIGILVLETVLSHLKAANFQSQIRKILLLFSLMLFVVSVIIFFVSNHHAIVHFCISWIHKTGDCFRNFRSMLKYPDRALQ